MKKHLLPIVISAAFAVLTPARVRAQASSNWGQSPKPEVVGKVQQAVAASRTSAPAAEKLLREAVVADPDYYRAQLNLGLVLLQQNRNADAAAELKKALDVQQRNNIKNPAIYAELGYAHQRADNTEKAAEIFMKGVEHLPELSEEDQKKLIFRGVTSFLEFQDPPGARKFVGKASGKIKPEMQAEVQTFLEDGIARITRSEAQEGWVRFAKQKETANPASLESVLFKKVNGEAGILKAGDIVTPASVVVNMRAEKPNPEKPEATLGKWVGFARMEEQFEVVEVVPVRVADSTALWMRVKRRKP